MTPMPQPLAQAPVSPPGVMLSAPAAAPVAAANGGSAPDPAGFAAALSAQAIPAPEPAMPANPGKILPQTVPDAAPQSPVLPGETPVRAVARPGLSRITLTTAIPQRATQAKAAPAPTDPADTAPAVVPVPLALPVALPQPVTITPPTPSGAGPTGGQTEPAPLAQAPQPPQPANTAQQAIVIPAIVPAATAAPAVIRPVAVVAARPAAQAVRAAPQVETASANRPATPAEDNTPAPAAPAPVHAAVHPLATLTPEPATAAPTSPASAPTPEAPTDFATLVDRIARARSDTAEARPVAITLQHAEFGRVDLAFSAHGPAAGNGGLGVTMHSADPGFAPAAAIAIERPAPAPQADGGGTPSSGQGSPDQSMNRGSGDPPRSPPREAQVRPPRAEPATPAADDSGIFA